MRNLVLGIFLTFVPLSSWAECSENVVDIEDMKFAVAIADEPREMRRGLMGIEEMPEWAGMLFVFQSQRKVSFWMKDTLIPLDLIFIDKGGEIIQIHDMARPHDLTSIESDDPVQYVLEINGGLSEKLGIEPGQLVISSVIGTGCPSGAEDPSQVGKVSND